MYRPWTIIKYVVNVVNSILSKKHIIDEQFIISVITDVESDIDTDHEESLNEKRDNDQLT